MKVIFIDLLICACTAPILLSCQPTALLRYKPWSLFKVGAAFPVNRRLDAI